MTDATLGPFRIVSRIARGGMGETFVGERVAQDSVHQRVCIKRLLTNDTEPGWPEMFRQEARVIARLNHPNIVSLVDLGYDDGHWWMALGLVDGTDLRNVLTHTRSRGAPMSLDVVAHIAIEIAKALVHAHGRRAADGTLLGIVHRDVSPGNIMITHDGGVLLTDFGIAKVQHGERTRTGYIKGKAGYMAPEQSMAEPLDGRTDLFALGVVLFEMLSGVRPFDGATWLATQANAVEGKRHRLRHVRSDAPEVLEQIIDRLLQPQMRGRYSSADALLDALSVLHVPANVVRELGQLAREAQPSFEDGITEVQALAESSTLRVTR